MEQLTGRQREVLEFLRQYIREHGYPPTIEETMRHFAFASPTAVTGHLEALRKKGYLEKTEKISRGISLKTERREMVEIPLLGRIPAGVPLMEEETAETMLLVDPQLVATKKSFALRIKGESMRDAGILDGDYVFVAKDIEVKSGDIVVAFLEGEFTVKFLFKNGGGIELRPANPAFPVLHANGKTMRILGKVISVFRQLP